VCSECPGSSTCTPFLVGGEVIGSVLITRAEPLDPEHQRRVRESVIQAAPVLANLRNLAIAEMRASTNSLTGLPNKRVLQDTVRRMAAQASRTIAPLAALFLDLDHFKQVNDVSGHARGDDVLAAVGAVMRSTLRGSDYAGRFGGEEFLILLPDTGLTGAVEFAERLRAAVAAISVSGVEQRITISIGVAVLPDHAGDADGLLRTADRALYAAKNNGRNRVETAHTSPLPAPTDGEPRPAAAGPDTPRRPAHELAHTAGAAPPAVPPKTIRT
jgi:diguanylate cyclase (GGDEF)-like protein